MRVNISLPDELHIKITQYCVKKGFKLSSLIAAKLSEELGEVPYGKIIDPGFNDLEEATVEVPLETTSSMSVHASKLAELRKLQEEIINKPATPQTPPTQEYGICPFCYIKKAKPVTLVTYLDQDQIKVEGKLCNECITKSKGSGSFVGLGGR